MVSEHGREQWVAEKTVKLGGGAGVARRGLRAAMAMAELRALGGCCSGEEKPRRSKWRRGMARAGAGVMKARSGAAWPARTDRRRRAAVSRATRRAVSETGRPLCRLIQFVSRAMQCLTMSFDTPLTANP